MIGPSSASSNMHLVLFHFDYGQNKSKLDYFNENVVLIRQWILDIGNALSVFLETADVSH